MRLKYGSVRTWSELTQRFYASKAEAIRGEELKLLEMAGEISDLQFQVPFTLKGNPKISITIDFAYRLRLHSDLILQRANEDSKKILLYGETIYEDVKGILTRDFRTKLAWLKEKYGVDVKLIRRRNEALR